MKQHLRNTLLRHTRHTVQPAAHIAQTISTATLTMAMLLCLTVNAWSQTGTVTGKVYDVVTKQPVPGATILVKGMKKGGVTQKGGTFSIDGLPLNDQLTLIARATGFNELERTITLTSVNASQ